MRSFATVALTLLGALSGLTTATEAAADTPSDVVTLTTGTFKDFITSHDLVLAEFYAPWCGHCKALAPKYEEAATELKAKNIPLVKVDCTVEEEVCKEYGVEGYPTLKVFRGLENPKPYNGARQTDSIVSYMIKQSLPAVSTVTEENLEEFKTMDKIVVVGFMGADDKDANAVFTKLAEAHRDDYLFGAAQDAALAKAEGVKQPAIVLYKGFDEKKAVYDGKLEHDDILAWIKLASTPLVGEVGPETYSGYMSAGIPLAYIFAETEEERTTFAEQFKAIAQKLKGKINIATIDAKAFGAHAGNLNLDTSKFPSFVIHNIAKNTKYPYDQAKKIVSKEVGQFIEDVLEGKIEPSIKSEPIPESQEGPVTVVVAHTYDELVINNDKDVLVEFYAPWCGHCKALAPKYEELARAFAGAADKVTIAKIDATANDIPEQIQGFPTIKLFPAGAKDAPVEYVGSRTIEDLAKFVEENGTHKVAAAVGEAHDAADVTAAPAAAKTEEATTAADADAAAKEKETPVKEPHDEL